MAPAPAFAAIWTDVLWCLGLGLLLAAARDLAGLAVGNGRVLCFVWDLLAFAVAAVLLCGFAAGVSASGVGRWYMAAAMAAGALGWRQGASGVVHGLAWALVWVLGAPLRLLAHRLVRPAAARLARRRERRRAAGLAQKSKKQAKNEKKMLQKPTRVLYN